MREKASARGQGPLRAAGPPVGLSIVQSKPVIGEPGDRYEREADTVARSVTAGRSAPAISRIGTGGLRTRPRENEEESIRRQVGSVEEEEPAQRQLTEEESRLTDAEDEDAVQLEAEEDEPIQTRSGPSDSVSGSMQDAAARAIRARGPGRPMHRGTRRTIERRIGVDLSDVRVHDGPQARAAAAQLRARAFTHGRDIWIGRGATDRSVSLMAHEAAHVVQQDAAGRRSPVQRQADDEEPVQRQIDSTTEENEEEKPVQTASMEDEEDLVQTSGVVQRSWLDETWGALKSGAAAVGETVTDTYDALAEKTEEAFWSGLKRVLPAPAVEFLQDVQDSGEGVVGALYEQVKSFAAGIFDFLGDQSPMLASMIETFKGFLARAKQIVQAFIEGDCTPLFEAISDFKVLLSDVAGDTWEKIADFFAPVGDFLEEVWGKLGSPMMDWIEGASGAVWETLKSIWEKIKTIGSKFTSIASEVGSALWGRIKEILGFGGGASEGGSDGGIVAWIKEQANAAWEKITETLQPVIEPIKKVAAKVKSLLPLGSIKHMQEKVQVFQENARQMDGAAGSPEDIVSNQKRLREAILPVILAAIDTVRAAVGSAKSWLISTVEGLAEPINTFFASLGEIDLLASVSETLDWVKSGVMRVKDWAANTAGQLFDFVDTGLQKLKAFARPVYRTLMKVVGVLGDFVGGIKNLVGSIWESIPACIREPIEDFLVNKILANVPFFSKLTAVKEAWGKIVNTVYTALSKVFVDGDLLGAAWTVFKALLNVMGIPPRLVISLVNNALKAFNNVFSDPIGFLINVAKSIQLGFKNFIDRFGTHVLGGLKDWVFGALRESGIEPPTEFSFKEVFRFLMEVFDITLDKVIDKVAKHLGVDRAVIDGMIQRIQKVVKMVGKGLEWIQKLVTEGPSTLWTWLQDKITGLWDTVQTQIVQYITVNVIQKVTAKLALALTPTGVSQVVAILESIWRAIQSAIEYMRHIIEVVNSAFESVNAIARGALVPAATRIEDTLTRTIPVAIGFLANQVGLGDLPKRLGTMIESVREFVDKGLEKLIGGATSLLQSAVQAVKGGFSAAKEKLLQWWKQKTKFTRNGETHSVGFEGEKQNARLVVASTPTPIESFISEERTRIEKLNDSEEEAKQRETLESIQQKAEEIQKIKTKDGTRDQSSFGVADGRKVQEKLNEIARLIEELGSEGTVPSSKIDLSETIRQEIPIANANRRIISTDAKVMDATVLSLKSNDKSGSQPTQQSKLWREVNKRSGEYVRGHLLNHHVHGPGSMENLTPITRSLNSLMESTLEDEVKEKVLSQNKVVHYRVEAVYGEPGQKRKHLPAENYIPTHLVFNLQELSRKEGTDGTDPAHWEGQVKETIVSDKKIENELPADTNPFTGSVLKRINLKAWTITDRDGRPLGSSHSIIEQRIRQIPGIGQKKAAALMEVDAWSTWGDLKTIRAKDGSRLFSDDDIQRIRTTESPVGGALFTIGSRKTRYEPLAEEVG